MCYLSGKRGECKLNLRIILLLFIYKKRFTNPIMERITISIPAPTITIKIQKTSSTEGKFIIEHITSSGELIGDIRRPMGAVL